MEIWVLLPIALLGGWVLGIVAFFRVLAAEREIATLRHRLAAGALAQPAAPRQAPEQAAEQAPVVAFADEPVAAAAAPMAEPPMASPAPAFDLEALLTQRWGLWVGAAALLLSGVFLIRYAVDNGLLGPAERCVLAALLGIGLLAGAEWLRRRQPEGGAPAALGAGGAAVLFGAAYGAGVLYELVPPLLGFALLAAAAGAGMLAALRFGQLTAAVGIAGAFVTPALVDTDNALLAGLFAYLLAVTAASLAVVRYAAWTWLGWAATIAGATWVVIASIDLTEADAWAPALFVPAAAALHLWLLPAQALRHSVGLRLSWIPFAVLGASGLLVEAASDGAAARAGVLLLSPLAVWKGWSEPRLDRLPWLAAGLFLMALLLWALPEWQPTGEVVTLEGRLQAVLPGAWAPDVIVPLLLTACGMAAFHFASGLVLESRAERPLPWAALAAAVPVLTLLVTYAQVARFQRDALWALTAGGVAVALTLAAWRARQAGSLPRAGTHAAGAVAALALGCAMVLNDQWLTLAVALFLPPLALIEARADLPPLRLVALAVAGVVLVRLLLNVCVLDYAFGALPIANGLLAAYGVPAGAFALAAWMFRKRADDRTVAVLEAGAIAFAVALVALEIRHGLAGGDLRGAFGFREAALQVAALAIEATLLRRARHRPVAAVAAGLLGGAALAGAALLLVLNPAFVPAEAGIGSLVLAYVVPGALAVFALREDLPPETRWMPASYAVLAGFATLALFIRYAAHPHGMALSEALVEDGEQWAYSGAWLLYGAALMGVGMLRGDRALRLAALAIIALVAGKVFLVDMADLAGLWRVMSFLGLGLALIGLGAAYRRFVIPPPLPPRSQA